MNFNDYAKTWDTSRRIKRAKIIADEISNVVGGAFKNKEKGTAIEFGCGTGLISFNLQEKFKKINLIDSSKNMIQILENKIDEYKVEHMFPHLFDLSKGDQFNEKVDVIYNSMVLHHIPNIKKILSRFNQMLNDDGYLIIIDLDEEDGSFHKDYPEFNGHNGFKQKDLKYLLESTGFQDIKTHTFYRGVKQIGDESIDYSLFIISGKKQDI